MRFSAAAEITNDNADWHQQPNSFFFREMEFDAGTAYSR
jgi:hypothetical protein